VTTERYVVKLASGAWLTKHSLPVYRIGDAHKMPRAEAYELAARHEKLGAVALRLKPSKRAAELAKLREEVEELRGRLNDCRAVDEQLRFSLDARTEERDTLRDQLEAVEAQLRGAHEHRIRAEGERDALAAQLAALPPDVSDVELAAAIVRRLRAQYAAQLNEINEAYVTQLAAVTRERDALREVVEAVRDGLDKIADGACDPPMTSYGTGCSGRCKYIAEAALAKLDEVKP